MKKLILIALIAFISAGCPNLQDGDEEEVKPVVTPVFYNPSGKAEKGPCKKDSDVEIYPLTDLMQQTGESYRGETREDDGSYVITAILEAGYGRYYFEGECHNEVEGTDNQLKMTMIAHSSQESKNINPPGRIQDLLAVEYFESGFGDIPASLAKAQSEILNYFNLAVSEKKFSEMSLQGNTADDGALGMINSVIAQGRTGPEQNDFMIEIANGILNGDETLKSDISADIYNIPVYRVVKNLRARYEEIGLEPTAPPIWTHSPHWYYGDLLDRDIVTQGSFNLADDPHCSIDVSDRNLYAVPFVFESWIETSRFIALDYDADISIWTRGFDAYDRPGVKLLDIEQLREIILEPALQYNGFLGDDHGLTSGTDYYIVIQRDENFVLTTGCAGGLLPFGRKLASNDGGLSWIGHDNNTSWYRNSGVRMFATD
jgi:hypothetical protein